MSTTMSPPSGPRWEDRRKERSARYARATGAAKNRAAALGYSTRRAQQVGAGDHTSTESRTLEHLDRLMDGGRVSPWPLIASQVEHVRAREIVRLSQDELCARWLRACETESIHQGRVDLHQLALRGGDCRESLEAVAELAPVQASALLELAALALEKLERNR